MSIKQLDLILVNPSNRRRAYQSLGTELAAVEPPVWARLLASFCLRQGLAVVIIDAEAEDLTPEQVEDLRNSSLYIQINSQGAPAGNLWGWFLREKP